jgi:retron-type reverse transcriptase
MLFYSLHSTGGLFMRLKLDNIQTITDLSKYFQLNKKLISDLAENEDLRKVHLAKIRKPNKKFREVVIVESMAYKLLLKTLAKYLNQEYTPLKGVTGYIKNRGIVDNAKSHLHKKIIVKFDIEDFFYSIHAADIEKVYRDLGATEEISKILSKISTFRGILYPGLNTSPILSNILLKELDKEYNNIARNNNCDYTRYADDITFSGNETIPTMELLESVLNKYNFRINKDKVKIMKMGRHQVVTGLSVFDKTMPRIPREKKRKIRLACYLMSKMDASEYEKKVPWCKQTYLAGLLIYCKNIEPRFVEKMMILSKKT